MGKCECGIVPYDCGKPCEPHKNETPKKALNVVSIGHPVDRVAAEALLLRSIHSAISMHVGVLTVAQVLGVLDICKVEIVEKAKGK